VANDWGVEDVVFEIPKSARLVPLAAIQKIFTYMIEMYRAVKPEIIYIVTTMEV